MFLDKYFRNVSTLLNYMIIIIDSIKNKCNWKKVLINPSIVVISVDVDIKF